MGKDFKTGLGVIFTPKDKQGEKQQTPPEESIESTLDNSLKDKVTEFRKLKSSHTKIPVGLVNTTLTVSKDKLDIFRALAYWERKKIKDYIDEALDYILSTKSPEEIDRAIAEYNKHYKSNI